MDGRCWLAFAVVVTGFVAALMYFGYLVLNKFTGGNLLRLEDVDEKLAQRLDDWMPLPEVWHGAARLWVIIVWCTYAVLAAMLCMAQQSGDSSAIWHGVASALAGIVVVCVDEAIVPRLSLRRMARCLCVFIPVFRFLSWLSFPFVWLPVMSNAYVKDISGEPADEAEVTTMEDEILSMITKSEDSRDEEVGIEDDERRMISGALALDDKTVHEIMTPRVDVDAVARDASLEDVKALIVKSGHSRIPVYDGTIDRIKGIIFAKDLLNLEKVSKARTDGLEAIVRVPLFVPETKNIGDLLAELQAKNTHFAVVIDEYGGTSGIVTFEDILEEIVGEIWDEYDVPEKDVVPDAGNDGWYIFDARTSIDEVNKQLETDIPEDEDYDTLAGYLSNEAGHIPQEKEHVLTDVLEAEILSAEPRMVKKVRARKRLQEEPEHAEE